MLTIEERRKLAWIREGLQACDVLWPASEKSWNDSIGVRFPGSETVYVRIGRHYVNIHDGIQDPSGRHPLLARLQWSGDQDANRRALVDADGDLRKTMRNISESFAEPELDEEAAASFGDLLKAIKELLSCPVIIWQACGRLPASMIAKGDLAGTVDMPKWFIDAIPPRAYINNENSYLNIHPASLGSRNRIKKALHEKTAHERLSMMEEVERILQAMAPDEAGAIEAAAAVMAILDRRMSRG